MKILMVSRRLLKLLPGQTGNGTEEVIYDIDYGSNKYNGRKPPYHRLDIRLNALASYWGLDWIFIWT